MAEPTSPTPIAPPTGGDQNPHPAWTGRTRGGYFGNWFFIQLVRRGGIWPAYAWLVLVAAYFTVASPQAYGASLDFLGRVFGPLPRWRRPFLVYRHFYAFGVSLLDRLAVLMGRHCIECCYEGQHWLQRFHDQGQGIILVGAHLGCPEIGAHFRARANIPVNLVVIEREVASIRRLFADALQSKRFKILTSDDNPLRAVPILAALRRGEVVMLHGDRCFGGEDTTVTFLGGRVRLPVGAYRLAAASGAPLFQVFVVREALGRYRFLCDPPHHITREQLRATPNALQACAQRYANRLEAMVRQYPFQWANLFPYWDDAAPGAVASTARPGASSRQPTPAL
jgi:predicted LPLAT superfamily acyltransferase